MAEVEQSHEEHSQQNQQQSAAMTTGPQVGPRPVSFAQAKAAFTGNDPTLGQENSAGVLALQQEARKGARAKWQEKREEFERKVAIKATKNPKVQDCVDEMLQKSVDFLLKMNADAKAQEDAIAALGGGKYVPKDERPNFAQVVAMMKSGSIREKMNLLGTFQETMGKQMLEMGPEKMKKQMDDVAKQKGANEERAKAEGKPELAGHNVQDITAQRKDAEGKDVGAASFGDKEMGKLAARADAVKADTDAKNVKAAAEGKPATATPSAAAMFKPTKAEETGKHKQYQDAKKIEGDTKLPMLSVAAVNQQRAANAAAPAGAQNPAVSALAPAKQGTAKAKDGTPVTPAGMTDAAEASSIVKSEKKLSEFATDESLSDEQNEYRLELSENEKKKAAENAVKEGKDEKDATLPWIEGQKANILDAEHEFIKDAKADSMPLKSGISGTTFRFMQCADILGVDADNAKMACVGMLQPLEAHSFHEIATAANGFSSKDEKTGKESTGQTYGKTDDKGKKADPYSAATMAPLEQKDLEEVAADCGTTMAYLNNPPLDLEPDGSPAPGAQGPAAAAGPPPPPAAPGAPEPPK